MDKILAKIIAFTKEVRPQEPKREAGRLVKFISGPRTALWPYGNIGGQWWYTEKASQECEAIASMALAQDPLLQGGDRETFSSIIMGTLQEHAWDNALFNGDIFFLNQSNRARNLFDARAIENAEEFARKLWDIMRQALSMSLRDWLVLYPLPRINTSSVAIGFDGVSLLKDSDHKKWEELSGKYTSVRFWDPFTGERRDTSNLPFYSGTFLPGHALTWLACQLNGTSNGTRRSARRLMTTFLGILFSHLFQQQKHVLSKSMGQSTSYSVQFSTDQKQICASIGVLLHPLVVDVDISERIINKVRNWYNLLYNADSHKQNRARVGSHFIQYAMVNSGVERFIYFFIALDALFGERNRVEKSILKGIERIYPSNPRELERAKKLFDLRSEIIHGGSSLIEDWKGLEHYRRYFRSTPIEDIASIAMTVLQIELIPI